MQMAESAVQLESLAAPDLRPSNGKATRGTHLKSEMKDWVPSHDDPSHKPCRRDSVRLRASAPLAPDRTLVERAVVGMRHAFEELFKRYRPHVRQVAERALGNGDAVDDVMQDAFLKAYENISRLKEPSRFRSWLLQITANRAQDYNRQGQYRVKCAARIRINHPSKSGPEGTRPTTVTVPDGPAHLQYNEIYNHIITAMESLPMPCRAVLKMRIQGETAQRKIASKLGIPEDRVRLHLRKARRILKLKLRPLVRESQA